MSIATDHIEVRYRPSDSAGAWRFIRVPAGQGSVQIPGVDRGTSYDIEARAIGVNGQASAWVAQTHVVADASLLPLDPTGLTALSVADGVHLAWTAGATQRPDVEYEVWRTNDLAGAPDPAGWAQIGLARATLYTDGVTDGVIRWYRVRAHDFSGHESNYTGNVNSRGKTSADGATSAQGQNVCENPSFELAALPGSSDICAGWSQIVTQPNLFTMFQANDPPSSGLIFSGLHTVYASINGGIAVPASSFQWTKIESRATFPVKSGEKWIAALKLRADSNASVPTGLSVSASVAVTIFFSDNSFTEFFGNAITVPEGLWRDSICSFTIPNAPAGKTVTSMVIYGINGITNSTGTAINTPSGGLIFDVRFDNSTLIRIATDGEVVLNASTFANGQGSIVPNQPIIISITYTDTTISLSWSSQSMLRPDGSTLVLAAGSQSYSGLTATHTYYIYPRINVAAGTLGFANGSPPPTSPNSTMALQSALDGFSPVLVIVQATAATGGGGSGTGGGGDRCPREDELVEIEHIGILKALQAATLAGQRIKGRNTKTGEYVWRKILAAHTRPCAAWYAYKGHKVSPCEPVWIPGAADGQVGQNNDGAPGKWTSAWQIPGAVLDPTVARLVAISVEADADDECNFVLVGGEEELLIHNVQPLPC